MKSLSVTLKFSKPGYIGNPYWPEMAMLIDIQKKSGMNRAKSDANRRKALEAYLRAHDMTYDGYLELERLARRPFHRLNGSTPSPSASASSSTSLSPSPSSSSSTSTSASTSASTSSSPSTSPSTSTSASPSSSPSPIIIPRERMLACLVNGCHVAPAAVRPCKEGQIRTMIHVSDMLTNRTEQDGIFRRFCTVTSGTGARLSNQRGLREDPFICDFEATGEIRYDDEHVKPDTLRAFLDYCGREIGVGASRKMGYGRFSVLDNGAVG